MENDYDKWNKQKKNINNELRPLFQEREIWWCFMGKNIGDEENGKGDKFLRPILVFKKFNSNIFIGISMTSTPKEGFYYHKKLNSNSYFILSQMKITDSKRLLHLIEKMSTFEFEIIKQKIKDVLNL